MTPFLDLRHIAIDLALVQHLPPGLARYYEAIPIAREGGQVTVAMSHPENVTALGVLTQLFRAEIVPIRTNSTALRALLEQLYLRAPAQPRGLLAWLSADRQPAWAALLTTMGLASGRLASGRLASGEFIEDLAVGGLPLLGNLRLSAECLNVSALLEPHGPPCQSRADLHPLTAEGINKGYSGSQTAIVHRCTGPIDNRKRKRPAESSTKLKIHQSLPLF